MSDASANSPALPPSQTEGWLEGPLPPREGWTTRKFIFLICFVFVFHVALVVLFGTKKQSIPRPVGNIPHLQLADGGNELIALGDPTLFARPNLHDVVTEYWRHVTPPTPPNFNWTEDPRYLLPAPVNFGATFEGFIQSTKPGEYPLNFKSEPKLVIPPAPADNSLPLATTMRISGDLVHRRLLSTIELPALPRNDVVAPSTIQALVDQAGNVASAVVLKSAMDNTRDTDADQAAAQLVRNLRFAPAPALMFGQITIVWHTVPTNAVPATTP